MSIKDKADEMDNKVARNHLNRIVIMMADMGIEEIVEVFPDKDGNRYKYRLTVEVVSDGD